MYGLNAFALVAFCTVNVLAVQLCKCDSQRRNLILQCLCGALLGINLLRYAVIFPFVRGEVRIPVEFSTVAYFVVPVILLLRLEKCRVWAAYSGLMAGFFYYMTMIAVGGRIYGEYPPYDVYLSLFCHGTLYLTSLVSIGTREYREKEGYKLLLGVCLVVGHSLLVRPVAEGHGRIFLYELLDGAFFRNLLPPYLWRIGAPVYYVVMSGLVLLSMKNFFRNNRKQYERFRKQFATVHSN